MSALLEKDIFPLFRLWNQLVGHSSVSLFLDTYRFYASARSIIFPEKLWDLSLQSNEIIPFGCG